MLLSGLTPGVAMPLMHLEVVTPMGPIQPLTSDRLASAWFHTLRALPPSPSSLLGMRAGGHGDPRARASPSEVNHNEPSFFYDTCNTPSHVL
jgi:hypothetical protein